MQALPAALAPGCPAGVGRGGGGVCTHVWQLELAILFSAREGCAADGSRCPRGPSRRSCTAESALKQLPASLLAVLTPDQSQPPGIPIFWLQGLPVLTSCTMMSYLLLCGGSGAVLVETLHCTPPKD